MHLVFAINSSSSSSTPTLIKALSQLSHNHLFPISSSSSSSFMGCSASRPSSFPNNTSSEDPSFSNYPSPVIRALSLPTPLVHHPPLRKGDTHHLVSLTSTTYASLLLSPPPHPKQSLSPDSVINTWELMDGLDDDFNQKAPTFDFPVVSIEPPMKPSSFQSMGSDGYSPPLSKPLWQHLSEEALLAKMDPNVAASYRRALSSRQLSYDHSKPPKPAAAPSFRKSEKESKIVVYFTSLRGIRKTYEDCCSVGMIFKGFGVVVDERDISMDCSYRKELQNLLGGKAVALPQVFIGENHIGGADEIRRLNEVGELTKLLKGFPVRDLQFVCKSCGDVQFVPCPNCCGSRKVFDEEDGRVRRCPDCNENGLIRCPGCCS